MNILGIDYGKKRIGLAWVQSDLDVVLPFGVVDGEDAAAIAKIAEMAKDENIDHIVVGRPTHLDGTPHEQTVAVDAFAEVLASESGLPVSFVDERLSSKQADAMGGDASRDERAAMIILQSYLDQQ